MPRLAPNAGLALAALALAACAVDEPIDEPVVVTTAYLADVATVEVLGVERPVDAEPDVCTLAAELPGDDVCSLVCDPTGFAARLVADGMDGGCCYQFRCELPGGTVVSVGACLP